MQQNKGKGWVAVLGETQFFWNTLSSGESADLDTQGRGDLDSGIVFLTKILDLLISHFFLNKFKTDNRRCSEKNVFLKNKFQHLRPLLRQCWAAIGCTENVQPIGATVH